MGCVCEGSLQFVVLDKTKRRACSLCTNQILHHTCKSKDVAQKLHPRPNAMCGHSCPRNNTMCVWLLVDTGDVSGKDETPFNADANRAIMRVKQKLEGTEGPDCQATTIAGQVAKLLGEAADPNNLCQMYAGWAPWLWAVQSGFLKSNRYNVFEVYVSSTKLVPVFGMSTQHNSALPPTIACLH